MKILEEIRKFIKKKITIIFKVCRDWTKFLLVLVSISLVTD
jgi:hypothetical protein